MALPNGKYHILNQDDYAGRNRIEDKSLLPKAVYCPPPSPPKPADAWIVEKLPRGRYKLSVRGAPTAAIGGRLSAILQDSPAPEQWIITRRSTGDYTIETSDKKRGWVRADEDDQDQRIEVRPLKVFKTNPPTFPPNELWDFVPFDKPLVADS